MHELVLTHRDGAVLEIVFNRPDKKNALTLSMYQMLTQALCSAKDDAEINVVVLRGEGDSFSAGNDIQDFLSSAHNPQGVDIILGFLHTLVYFDKPIIAAVQGDAVGIGTTMLLHCDVVIAAQDLRCKMPFVKLGLIPEGGSTLLVPSLVGQRQAFEMMVEGQDIDAEKAMNVGLVNQIVPLTNLLEHVRSRSKAIASLPPHSVKISKALMKKSYIDELHQVIDDEGRLFYERLSSKEAKSAFMKFLQVSS